MEKLTVLHGLGMRMWHLPQQSHSLCSLKEEKTFFMYILLIRFFLDITYCMKEPLNI